MQVRKQQLELDMEQMTGSKSGKEYIKAVYCPRNPRGRLGFPGHFIVSLFDNIHPSEYEVLSHWSVIICISEVIDISPGNLDFSSCFIQPSISHDVLCIEVK